MTTEEKIKQFLTSEDFEVTKLPESDSPTPDFLVQDQCHRYLIEVKDKFPNPEKMQEREETLSRGEMYKQIETTGRVNVFSSVIRDGAKQLSSFNDEKVDFRLLWIQAMGLDPQLQMRQCRSTLYGSLHVLEADGLRRSFEAYAVNYNEFYPYRHVLDAAILGANVDYCLCLNPFSPRSPALLHTRLASLFGEAITDPLREESADTALLADFDCDRSDRVEVLNRLACKYDIARLVDFELQQLSGEIPLG